MRRNALILSFLGLLILATTITAVLAWLFVQNMRELRSLQAEATRITAVRTTAQALLNESMAYSQRDPSIDPILQSIGAKGRTTNAPAQNRGAR